MFSQVLEKSLPQSVLAPWRAVLTAGFPRVWANIPRLLADPSCWIRARSPHSGSGTTLGGGLSCREPAGVSRCGGPRLGDFLAAHQPSTCWASMIFRTKGFGIASESDPQN